MSGDLIERLPGRWHGIDQSHEVSHPLSHHHLYRPNTDMDEIRGSFSRLKKKLKHRLTGSKREPGRTGAGEHGESINPAGPHTRAESPVVAGGRRDRGGDGANVDGRRARSTDRPQQPDEPESAPASGSENDQERREADADGRVISYSRLRPDVEVTAGSGSSRDGGDPDGKAERVYPSPSPASIPHSETPDSTWVWLFWLLPLIIPPDTAGPSAIPDRLVAVSRPNESAAADENKPSWKFNAFSMAKLLLYGVRDSADAFGPLKSVESGLCFILENYEVRPSTSTIHNAYGCPQRTEANKQAIESLAPRVKALAELLCAPVSEGDVEERERRAKLEQ